MKILHHKQAKWIQAVFLATAIKDLGRYAAVLIDLIRQPACLHQLLRPPSRFPADKAEDSIVGSRIDKGTMPPYQSMALSMTTRLKQASLNAS